MEIRYRNIEDAVSFGRLGAGDLFMVYDDKSENPTILMKTKEYMTGGVVMANAVTAHTGSLCVMDKNIAVIPVKHELIVEV